MIKNLTCIGCRVDFTYDHRKGPTRQRCDSCTVLRKLETDATKAKRWRDANLDRARDHWNRSNRKRLADPAYVAGRRVRRRELQYGLTQVQYDDMLASQGDVCAVCSNEHVGPGSQLHVDHDHTTGKVRALLCSKCNTLIGLADDSPERLELAAAYLRSHKGARDGNEARARQDRRRRESSGRRPSE